MTNAALSAAPPPLTPASTWIIIPNQNGMRWLPDCLRTLAETVPADATVLLADNASTDGGPEFAIEKHAGVRVLRFERNLGFVQAVNVAMASALRDGAEAMVLLNNDVRMRPGWFDRLLAAANRSPTHGVLGPVQVSFLGVHSPRTRAILDEWATTQTGTALAENLPPIVDTQWVEGSCLMVRRCVLERVGLLDPLFAPAYWEEVEFCRRALRAGYGVGMVADSVIEHHGAGSSGAKSPWRRVLLERNGLIHKATNPDVRWPTLTVIREAIAAYVRRAPRRELTLTQWLRAVVGVGARWPGLLAKWRRERWGLPCPLLGDRVPSTPEQLSYARWLQNVGWVTPVSETHA